MRVAALAASGVVTLAVPAAAHHSFAMYDEKITYVLTGVVTRVSPDPSHLSIFFSVLNDARGAVIRDASGDPITWAVELRSAAQVAQDGVTVQNFPPGTIFSIGLHPLRNGLPGGGRGKSGLFKCPPKTPPAAGKHCDSVAGATSHGQGALPQPPRSGCPEQHEGRAVAARDAQSRSRDDGVAETSASADQLTTTVMAVSSPSPNALSSRKLPPSAAVA